MDNNNIGKTIAFLRKKAGYTQKDLADRIGISDKAVSKWERGLSLPDISYLSKLSILLNIDSDSLLSGAPITNKTQWQGILILTDNPYGISSETIIYDKPLVYYLLSYFLLVGIKNIFIVCNDYERAEIQKVIGDWNECGIVLNFTSRLTIPDDFEFVNRNYMLVFGRSILYGVELTRFFQKAMTDLNKLTILALPKKADSKTSNILFDSSKKIVNSNPDNPLKLQYDYCSLPFLFFPSDLLPTIVQEKNIYTFISNYAETNDVYVELLDRGFVEFDICTWNSVFDASTFVKLLQDRCGMNVYCLEEVAWRRGLITLDQLKNRAVRYKNTEYGNYLIDLYDLYINKGLN